MATWYLMNTVRVGTSVYRAGAYIDDSTFDTTNLISAGGKLVASATSGMAAAAAEALSQVRRGNADAADGIMNAALDYAQTAQTAAQDTVDAATATNTATVFAGSVRMFAPAAADLISIVADVLLADGAQIIAAQPDYPRHAQVRITDGDSSITAGTATIVGIGIAGEALEQIIPLTGGTQTVVTDDVYATITSVTVAGLAGHGAGDNIGVGFGAGLGLPIPALATAVVVTKVVVDSADEVVAGVDAAARSVEPTTAANGVHNYDFFFGYSMTPIQAAHTHTLS